MYCSQFFWLSTVSHIIFETHFYLCLYFIGANNCHSSFVTMELYHEAVKQVSKNSFLSLLYGNSTNGLHTSRSCSSRTPTLMTAYWIDVFVVLDILLT
jgi:hypothetical protein